MLSRSAGRAFCCSEVGVRSIGERSYLGNNRGSQGAIRVRVALRLFGIVLVHRPVVVMMVARAIEVQHGVLQPFVERVIHQAIAGHHNGLVQQGCDQDDRCNEPTHTRSVAKGQRRCRPAVVTKQYRPCAAGSSMGVLGGAGRFAHHLVDCRPGRYRACRGFQVRIGVNGLVGSLSAMTTSTLPSL